MSNLENNVRRVHADCYEADAVERMARRLDYRAGDVIKFVLGEDPKCERIWGVVESIDHETADGWLGVRIDNDPVFECNGKYGDFRWIEFAKILDIHEVKE